MLTVYKRPKQNSQLFVEEVSQLIDRCSRFDNAMVLGDFNLEPDDKDLSSL